MLISDQYFMELALRKAKKAKEKGEVPVGAVIVKNGIVVSASNNSVEKDLSSLMHAEIKAIYRAQKELENWRLTGCVLYVTLEPCLMCCGAILLSRIKKLVYAAADPKGGAAASLYRTLEDARLNHRVEVVSGVMETEAAALLADFFKEKRLN